MKPEWIGAGIPSKLDADLKGRLIVLEGTDCVGRSTQIRLLQDWLENQGYGVVTTSLCRSELVEPGLRRAKRRNQVGRRTLALLYATDLADRLEREILPALESGFVVLSDRYIYTLLARFAVRGVDPDWLRRAYGFALVPHLVLYLDVKLNVLVERALKGEKLGFWECGLDLNLSNDLYESFLLYQRRMLKEFSRITKEFNLERVKANGTVNTVQPRLRKKLMALLDVRDTELDPGDQLGSVVEGVAD
jgi:dTMP kinase